MPVIKFLLLLSAVDENNAPGLFVQDIATRLNTNWTNSHIDHNVSYHAVFKKPPVNDTGSTLIDGVTPIYRDENSGSDDLYIKIGDNFANVKSNGETYSTSSGTKIYALETAPISSLDVETTIGHMFRFQMFSKKCLELFSL